MSIDLRLADKKDPKTTFLLKPSKEMPKPIELNYNIREPYYQIKMRKIKIGDSEYLIRPKVTVMIDSGTTFNHFPIDIHKKFMILFNQFCYNNPKSCGKLAPSQFEEDTCLDLK